jgi:hypothetical protein
MNTWFVVALAALAANLPFLNHRIFGFIRIAMCERGKPFWIHLGEWCASYCFVGGVAFVLETSQSNSFAQHWEFFAITICLFIVLAFPGFVARYLVHDRSKSE